MPIVERIADRLLRDNCPTCGDVAAYVVDGARLCLVHAEDAAPGTIPALPKRVELRWHLDPVGAEVLDWSIDADLDGRRRMLSVQPVYRILPDTLDAVGGWVKGRPWTEDEHHGFTMRHVLLDVREKLADARQARRGSGFYASLKDCRVVSVANYGYTFYG